MQPATDKTAPVQTLTAALLLLLVLSGLPVAVAQPDGDTEARAQIERASKADASEDAPDSKSDDGEMPASGDSVVLSPFDYEASESISEDSSVSFPVDI